MYSIISSEHCKTHTKHKQSKVPYDNRSSDLKKKNKFNYSMWILNI